MNIGEAIRTLRHRQHLRQGVLAAMCKMRQNRLCQLELGRHTPHQNTLRRIADALGVTVPYILLFALEKDDLPEDKRGLYEQLIEPMKDML